MLNEKAECTTVHKTVCIFEGKNERIQSKVSSVGIVGVFSLFFSILQWL